MTTWKYDGVDLETFGVLTELDDPLDMAQRRGSNIVVPFRPGALFTEKMLEERSIVIGLAVARKTPSDLEGAMSELRALLSSKGQKTLLMTNGGFSRNAQAHVSKSLQVNRPAPWVAKLAIEFELAEPFFRDVDVIADNTTTIDASPKAMTVTNPGTIEERDPTIVLTGPLTNPVITNSTNGYVLTYTGTISSGHIVTIETSEGEFKATHSVSGNVIGNVTHSGGTPLMLLEPGDNTLSITSSVTTTGTVKISFRAPYI